MQPPAAISNYPSVDDLLMMQECKHMPYADSCGRRDQSSIIQGKMYSNKKLKCCIYQICQ